MDVRSATERLFQVWNGDLAAIDDVADPEIQVSYPLLMRTLHGRDSYRRVMARVHERFPDFAFVPEPAVVDGDRAAIAWRGGGTHTGLLLGVPATGCRVSFSGISLYRVRDGRVVSERGEEDTYAILRQVGALADAGR